MVVFSESAKIIRRDGEKLFKSGQTCPVCEKGNLEVIGEKGNGVTNETFFECFECGEKFMNITKAGSRDGKTQQKPEATQA